MIDTFDAPTKLPDTFFHTGPISSSILDDGASSSSFDLPKTTTTTSQIHKNTGAIINNENETEIAKLRAEIENLRFQLDMQRVRLTPIAGPMNLTALPDAVLREFGRDLQLRIHGEPLEDGRRDKSTFSQAPRLATKLMKRNKLSKSWKCHWTRELVDPLIDAVQNHANHSRRDYPGSALLLQQAMEDYIQTRADRRGAKKGSNTTKTIVGTLTEPKILVVGSKSPWAEAIALAETRVSKVYMADWQPVRIDDDRIECILMSKLVKERPTQLFNVIISFSSTEHDGLGRYGDPINPNGDLAAMAEFHTLLQPNGHLLLGVPYQPDGNISSISNQTMNTTSLSIASSQPQVESNKPPLTADTADINRCFLDFRVNGAQRNINQGSGINNEVVVQREDNDKIKIAFTGTAFTVIAQACFSNYWTCHFNTDICTPDTDVTGLLGTPGGDRNNEFINPDKTFTETIPAGQRRTQPAFDFCKQYYAADMPEKSEFIYASYERHAMYDYCDATFPGTPESATEANCPAGVWEQIEEICDGDEQCLT